MRERQEVQEMLRRRSIHSLTFHPSCVRDAISPETFTLGPGTRAHSFPSSANSI
jgi:hypothetical protein